MALSLFGQSQVFQGHLPGLSWHAKRAGRNSGTTPFFNEKSSIYKYFNSFKPGLNFSARLSSATQILVVDDVMTTGLTMRTIFNQLKELGAQSVEGLVIASSS
jgi:predicted amidophosphoribosyltransferase